MKEGKRLGVVSDSMSFNVVPFSGIIHPLVNCLLAIPPSLHLSIPVAPAPLISIAHLSSIRREKAREQEERRERIMNDLQAL